MSEHEFSSRDGLLYGSLGLPLVFVALPLYVVLPNHYAREFGVPLALLGALLLAARLLDAFIDPLLGRLSDRLFSRSIRSVLVAGVVAALGLATGFAGLFFPPVREINGLMSWAAAALVLTYTAYSLLSITHQSWGAMLGGDESQRARVVAWREGLGLVGVVLAALAPVLMGLPATAALLTVCLALGWLAWTLAPRPAPAEPPPFPVPGAISSRVHRPDGTNHASSIWHPFTRSSFRRLLGVLMLNGIASAIPATLVLFFVQDRLQAPPALEPAFLGMYFVSAALSLPLWMRGVRLFGLARTWLAGIVLAVAVFAWAATLGAGDANLFLIVCALSGVALGTDLALPGALLAGVIAANGDRGQAEGAYFGWWNFAVKLNLALAAGLALPLLSLAGYTPGTSDPQALQALTLSYCVLPCALKLLAAGALYALVIRPAPAHRVIPNLQSTS
jgi:glycoside/pentoside/hexuronide:cation symporter, GPH family